MTARITRITEYMHTHVQISMNVWGVMDVVALRRVTIQLAAIPALATVDTREMATGVQVRQNTIFYPPYALVNISKSI